MKKKFGAILIFLFLTNFVCSQEKRLEEIERSSTLAVRAECKEKETIRFRLFNNTNWAIAVSTFSFYLTPDNVRRVTLQNGRTVYLMPNDKEISSLFYFTERAEAQGNEKILVLGGYKTDSYNSSWIGSKDSIFFSIPKNNLRNAEVYVPFNFEWELTEQGTFMPDGPKHRLYFRFPNANKSEKLEECLVTKK